MDRMFGWLAMAAWVAVFLFFAISIPMQIREGGDPTYAWILLVVTVSSALTAVIAHGIGRGLRRIARAPTSGLPLLASVAAGLLAMGAFLLPIVMLRPEPYNHWIFSPAFCAPLVLLLAWSGQVTWRGSTVFCVAIGAAFLTAIILTLTAGDLVERPLKPAISGAIGGFVGGYLSFAALRVLSPGFKGPLPALAFPFILAGLASAAFAAVFGAFGVQTAQFRTWLPWALYIPWQGAFGAMILWRFARGQTLHKAEH